jgi:ribonucleoside-diphosphate reductase beta chain
MATTDIPVFEAPVRKASGWTSTRGFKTNMVPWRLYEKAKQGMWDPADIDFTKDVEDWSTMTREQQAAFASSCRGFMIGEEGVTLDIGPLLIAMADEGRTEEVMYLTTFAFEEAKHIDFFRRWFDAVDLTGDELFELSIEGAKNRGIAPPDPERTTGMFESELPRIMRKAMLERSPETILNASITYNQWIEACLAISGYRRFAQMFKAFPGLPGLQEGLRLIRTDEGRHITYGTYLCRRIIAAHPDLMVFARERLQELYDDYYVNLPAPAGSDEGTALKMRDEYSRMVRTQKERRVQILERAALLTEEEAESDRIAEEVEAELAEL